MAQSEQIGCGPTDELRLRVSAAALARVTFVHPHTGVEMLALERKAWLDPAGEPRVTAQPFGGGMRILQPALLRERIGAFHYDSPRSRDEQDLRILINPADWERVRSGCLEIFRAAGGALIETSPARELEEEFGETFQASLCTEDYTLEALDVLVENTPVQSTSPRAGRVPTVRIYAVFAARLGNPEIIRGLLASAQLSDPELGRLAQADARSGGRGHAHAALALPLDLLVRSFQAQCDGDALVIAGHRLEGNIAAVLPGVFPARYERFGG